MEMQKYVSLSFIEVNQASEIKRDSISMRVIILNYLGLMYLLAPLRAWIGRLPNLFGMVQYWQ